MKKKDVSARYRVSVPWATALHKCVEVYRQQADEKLKGSLELQAAQAFLGELNKWFASLPEAHATAAASVYRRLKKATEEKLAEERAGAAPLDRDPQLCESVRTQVRKKFKSHFYGDAATTYLRDLAPPATPRLLPPAFLDDLATNGEDNVWSVATAPSLTLHGLLVMAVGNSPRVGEVAIITRRPAALAGGSAETSPHDRAPPLVLDCGGSANVLSIAFHPSWPSVPLLAVSTWSGAVLAFDLGKHGATPAAAYEPARQPGVSGRPGGGGGQARCVAWSACGAFLATAFAETRSHVLLFRTPQHSATAATTASGQPPPRQPPTSKPRLWSPAALLSFPSPCWSVAACEEFLAVGMGDARVVLLNTVHLLPPLARPEHTAAAEPVAIDLKPHLSLTSPAPPPLGDTPSSTSAATPHAQLLAGLRVLDCTMGPLRAEIYGLTFSPPLPPPSLGDGGGGAVTPAPARLLASGAWNGAVHLWEPRSGMALAVATLTAKSNRVAFSPDGRQLAVAGWNASSTGGMLSLFDVCINGGGGGGGGGGVLQLASDVAAAADAHTSVVYDVAFSPCGRALLSGSWDKSAKLWRLPPQQQQQQQQQQKRVVDLAEAARGGPGGSRGFGRVGGGGDAAGAELGLCGLAVSEPAMAARLAVAAADASAAAVAIGVGMAAGAGASAQMGPAHAAHSDGTFGSGLGGSDGGSPDCPMSDTEVDQFFSYKGDDSCVAYLGGIGGSTEGLHVPQGLAPSLATGATPFPWSVTACGDSLVDDIGGGGLSGPLAHAPASAEAPYLGGALTPQGTACRFGQGGGGAGSWGARNVYPLSDGGGTPGGCPCRGDS